ncbi:MAG TPA: ribosome biogenesis/translation initiation ATPase RLI [Candidatus Thermoplasmatota archaeon]|nr:ribosome biogenesis/translation initiation ATPase RLI [Candidatus Thermoplasmatota archaeon]
MRIAVVEKDRCQPRKCNFECHHFCPIVRQGKPCVWMGEDNKAKISETLCIGCNICVVKCPFDAIHIINLPEELKEDLLQQYGENAFRLYRLPVPRKGSVVGLLGANGIGKTTAIRILSGQELPNLGDWTAAPSWQPAIDKYSATELGDYLRHVAAGNVKTALKPQYVDKLPQAVKGKVGDLLRKTDERGALAHVVDALALGAVLDSDLAALSGGELQRVAIAATALKEADVYFFDEPSSYLDIGQRLRAARMIRTLAAEKAVVVIEHDLAVLDFLADDVHVLYGTPAAYGIVTIPRPVRSSINVYLSGFLREENIRFRDTTIEFEAHPPRKDWQAHVLLEFPELEKSYESFRFRSQPGQIRVGEVVGVVGPNATGKTTFVKMLAGEIAPTRGTVDVKVKVSYKPQYVKGDYEGTVQELLYVALAEQAASPFFLHEIARPLDLEKLSAKSVDKLSGGELQRVAVALALARPAELYLLDEPSAYLDVEQRMVVAKTIRRVMEKTGKSALVVDHDVYFIDLIADSVMTFGGNPGVEGLCAGPFPMREGMNRFLADVGVTFRRDKDTRRPRVNKEGSRLDVEQRASGEYYYAVEDAAAQAE